MSSISRSHHLLGLLVDTVVHLRGHPRIVYPSKQLPCNVIRTQMANVTWPIYNNIEFVAATTSTDFYVDCASWLRWLCLDKPVHRAHLPSWNGVLSLCAWSPSLMLFQLQMRYNSLVHDPLGQQDQPGQPTNETFDRRKCDSRHNQVFSSFFFSSYLAGYEMRVNLRGAPQAHLRIMHCYLCSYRCTPDHRCP